MASLGVGGLGEFLREQRRQAKLSLRQLAEAAGVSNPYLSQIERGLRKPSAEILQQIAKGLRISAETLYVQAGILDERAEDPAAAPPGVREAILADPLLTEEQQQALLQIYAAFRQSGAARQPEADAEPAGAGPAAESGRSPWVERVRRAAQAPPAPGQRTPQAEQAQQAPQAQQAEQAPRAAEPRPEPEPAAEPEPESEPTSQRDEQPEHPQGGEST